MLPSFEPLPLERARGPFTHADWFFEIKWDGFRALAYIENGRCRLVSRNGNEFKSFSALNVSLPLECRAQRAVLDGEIVCLNDSGSSQFRNLLFRRGEPRFYAFDLLYCDGEDLRYLPLQERKHRLKGITPRSGLRLLYCDHIELAGEEFFQLVCERDLEGIVAKRRYDPYLADNTTWLKIRNRSYSQWAGREELFEGERPGDPDMGGWNCVLRPVTCSSDDTRKTQVPLHEFVG
jgi:bifunctional non-homologous end joining protein LigD